MFAIAFIAYLAELSKHDYYDTFSDKLEYSSNYTGIYIMQNTMVRGGDNG